MPLDDYYDRAEVLAKYKDLYERHGLVLEGGHIGRVGFTGPGWFTIIENLIVDLVMLGWDKRLCQVKEKFGGLRFYIEGGTDAIFARIAEAERLSGKTCEVCGEPGTLSGVSWYKTACEAHSSGIVPERIKDMLSK